MAVTMEKETLVTNVTIKAECENEFVDWQTKLNATIAKFPGFVSLEILSLKKVPEKSWSIAQRFRDSESCSEWKNSIPYKELLEELKGISEAGFNHKTEFENKNAGVTEVFVTQVSPDKEESYREWIAKIHQAEAKFPGFRRMYVQSPPPGQGNHWITFLQFDTSENMDRWLNSSERKQILEESAPLIASLESHRVFSPYGAWFSSVEKVDKVSVWKQTMLILLVLFPLVMLEMRFLPIVTGNLNPSLATFISNAISVTLLAWPLIPAAIWLMKGWLLTKPTDWLRNILGILFLVIFYIIEIAIFWV